MEQAVGVEECQALGHVQRHLAPPARIQTGRPGGRAWRVKGGEATQRLKGAVTIGRAQPAGAARLTRRPSAAARACRRPAAPAPGCLPP